MSTGRTTRARAKAAAASSSQAAQQGPPPPDTDPEMVYDPRAAKYEKSAGFKMPWSYMLENYLKIRKRKFEHTRFMDMETLERFGVAEQFIELSSKVGLSPRFWGLREIAYRTLAEEFLSSLKLLEQDGRDYIWFRLGNEAHKAWLDEVARVYGLEYEGIEEFSYTRDPNHQVTKNIVWQYLCGKGKKYQSRLVQHPTLRILLRGIAATVFARGETVNIASEKEIEFMWHILQPEPEKVNVMKLMVKHWIFQRDLANATGSITMGSFVTILAKRMRIALPEDSFCTGYSTYDDDRFRHARFIKICHTGWDVHEKYLWLREDGSNFYLPYPHKIDVSQRCTWLVPKDFMTPGTGRKRQIPPQEPTPMEVEGPSEPRYSTHFGEGSNPPPWAQDLMSVMGNLSNLTMETRDEVRQTRDEVRRSTELINEQGMQLSRLSNEFMQFGRRLDDVANMTYDNNFYLQYGYWPGGDDDPNLPTPAHSSSSHAPQEPQPQQEDPLPPQPARSDPAFYPYLGNQMHVQQPPPGPDAYFDFFPSYDSQFYQGGFHGGSNRSL